MQTSPDPLIFGLSRDVWSVLGIICTAIAAIGTLFAVGVSLWLAKRKLFTTAKLEISFAYLPPEMTEYFAFHLVNNGERPIKATSVGWTIQAGGKPFTAVEFATCEPPVLSSPLPYTIGLGEDATWLVPVNGGEWYVSLARELSHRPSSIKPFVGLSSGGRILCKAPKGVLKRIRKEWGGK